MSEICNKTLAMLEQIITPQMTKDDYKEVINFFNKHYGFMSKCQDMDGNITGYLVRIESPCSPNFVFINYRKCDSFTGNLEYNSYFEKSVAILQTIKKGMRWLKNKNYNVSKNVGFDEYICKLSDTVVLDNKNNFMGSIAEILDKNFSIDGETDISDDCWYINNNNEFIDSYLYDYMKNFENKVEKYYGETYKNKRIIVLPF